MTNDPAKAFWDFSVAVYRRPGVAPACLTIQDRHGLDVNLILFCCWAGACGRLLSDAEVERLVTVAGPWRTGAVEPLRALRRWLKRAEGAPAELAAPFREQVKALELEAERIEQRTLCDTLPLATDRAPPDPAAAAANLQVYLRRHGPRPEARDSAALGEILTGCFEDLTMTEALRLLA